MQEFVRKIFYSDGRPCVTLDNGILALIDTGAKIPVWTQGETLLKEYYPDAKKVLDNAEIGLFVGSAIGTVYIVTIILDKLIFQNIPIFVIDDDSEFAMLLSNTMFLNLEMRLDQKDDYMHLIIPDGESLIRNLVFNVKGNKIILSQK